jgi:hypothetical protein
MRQFNRILGFVAVSFVLVFLGKVNKVGLYTVYFKTLADVEIRNSTAHDHGDTQFVAAGAEREVQNLTHSTGGNAVLADENLLLLAQEEGQSIILDAPAAPSLGLRCFMEVAPRAPGA